MLYLKENEAALMSTLAHMAECEKGLRKMKEYIDSLRGPENLAAKIVAVAKMLRIAEAFEEAAASLDEDESDEDDSCWRMARKSGELADLVRTCSDERDEGEVCVGEVQSLKLEKKA